MSYFPALVEHLISFNELIEERAQGFVGRDSVFADFSQFRKHYDRGYFVVIGEPGIGKTAISSQLVKTQQYVHYFANATGNVGRPDRLGFTRKSGQSVKTSCCNNAARTLPGIGTPGRSDGVDDYRNPRCTKRCRSWLAGGIGNFGSERVRI